MIPATIESLLQFLPTQHYDVQYQAETDQLYYILNLHQRDFPFFIRVVEEEKLIQLIGILPCQFMKESLSDLARLLHHLNRDVDLPGFGMDENVGIVYYRLMIPAYEGKLEETLFITFLNSAKIIVEAFYPTIEAICQRQLTYEQFLRESKKQ